MVRSNIILQKEVKQDRCERSFGKCLSVLSGTFYSRIQEENHLRMEKLSSQVTSLNLGRIQFNQLFINFHSRSRLEHQWPALRQFLNRECNHYDKRKKVAIDNRSIRTGK